MERRQLQITKLFETVVEEKCALSNNLDKIINQVMKYVDQAKLHTQRSDLTKILTFELDVLKKFMTINNEIEAFLETPLKLTCPESPTIIQNPRDESINAQLPEVSIPEIPNLLSGNEPFSPIHHFSDPDVQSVRETFKEISQKLGLNSPSLNSMKHIYEKPSTSALREFSNITLSDVSNSISCISEVFPERHTDTSFEGNTDNFQIPEKDLNTSTIKDQNVQICDIKNDYRANIEGSQLINLTRKSPVIQAEDCTDTDSDQFEIMLTANNSSQEEASENQFDSTDESSDETNFENNNLRFEDKTNAGSALEKLNNYRSCKVEENNLKMEPLKLPDLKLKPSHQEDLQIIQNINQKETERKMKSKKKNHDSIQDNKIYELRYKDMPNEQDMCAFSHIESPSEFYIHIADKETTLIDKISMDLYEKYNNSSAEYETKGRACKGIQKFCCAYIHSFDSWYRAEVIDWLLGNEDEDVLIQLVDYGNRCKTSFKYLRKLRKEFTRIPMLAIRCHFPLMYPPDSTTDNRLTEWPQTTLEGLKQLSGLLDETNHKLFKLSYISYEEELYSLAIDLYNVQDGDENTTIGEILLDLGLATQILDDYHDPYLRTFLQDVDGMERDENINEVVTGYDAKDEVRICRFTKPDGTCFKGKHCKLEHVPLSKDGFTTDKEIVYKEAMYSLMLPPQGSWRLILITSYVDTCNFFAQIINNPCTEKNYVLDRDLYCLLETMNSPINKKTYQEFKYAPAIGEIVISKHWTKQWLRAVVRDFSTDENGEVDEVQVFYLDFGETRKEKISTIRKIQPRFLELPFQAVLCYIHNYKMSPNCNVTQARQFFHKNLYFNNFLANIMFSDLLPLKIELLSKDGQINIGQSLEQNGFAVPRLADIHPVGLELY